MSDHHTLDTLLQENRQFPPSAEFAAQANFNDPAIYAQALENPVEYWSEWARTLDWIEPWHTAHEWNCPDAKWFLGGKINACYNCVDRHALGDRAHKTAILWEGEPGDVRTLTYSELKNEVSRVANALKALGVQKGDRVCIYMPMVPELAMAMLACARIGAIHSVVFGGFSAESLFDRVNDASAKVILTADGGWRRGSVVPLLKITEDALALGCPTVEHVVVFGRIEPELRAQLSVEKVTPEGSNPNSPGSGEADPGVGRTSKSTLEGRQSPPPQFHNWMTLIQAQSTECACEAMDSEDLLYILYTSGSTGKPKGIVHATGGYMTGVTATAKMVFDLKEDDIYWCTADCGWVTGHSYIVYGPLANGATVVMYEGAPDTPEKDRFWRIIERHRVTILYTAPTAIRTFMKWGIEYPSRCDLSSLRLLGSVGEPINPEAWMWYHEFIGGSRCPIVDTWWQTETGAIMISPLPGITTTKPGSATQPLPGIHACVFDESGKDITPVQGALSYYSGGKTSPPEARGGILTLTNTWPSMTRGIWGDPQRYKDVYWNRFPGIYFAGDGCKVDEDGCFWLLGRVDDIMLVAGHNISTMEVESALVDHPAVAEAAVIGKTHEVKGQAICAFVIVKTDHQASDYTALIAELKAHVAKKIGAVARPDDIIITADVPKTRSGKIMRRLLRDVAEGRALGDTTTLADPAVVASLKDRYDEG